MSKITDTILGFIVGDAFGVPYGFKKRGTFEVSEEMIGFGSHHQPAGTWSDDSSMMLATLQSIIDQREIDEDDIMYNFLRLYYSLYFTANGKMFDIGGRTQRALTYYHKDKGILPDDMIPALGNGSLMRILPLALFDANHNDIEKISQLTHPNNLCSYCRIVYCNIVKGLLAGLPFDNLVKEQFKENLKGIPSNEIESDGHVLHTLTTAPWAVSNSNSYKDAIIKAVELGDDTDTIAALAGALAGVIYGQDAIPEDWLNQIKRLDWIKDLCEKAENLSQDFLKNE